MKDFGATSATPIGSRIAAVTSLTAHGTVRKAKAVLLGIFILATTLAFQARAGANDLTLRSSSRATNNITMGLTIPRPSKTVAGDVMVAALYVRLSDSVRGPSGWKFLRHDHRTWVYYRVAGSSEPSSYRWTFPTRHLATGMILDYAGVNRTNPIMALSGKANDRSSRIYAPGVTTTASRAVVVGFFGMGQGSTLGAPSSMTQRVLTSAHMDFRNIRLLAADYVPSSVGATGGKTATSSLIGRSGGELLALRAAPLSSTTTTPPPPSTSAFRAFSANSYWNTPLSASTPVDPNSSSMLSFLKADNFYGYVRLPGAWMGGGHPIYWATDATPEVPLLCSGYCAKATPTMVRIPSSALSAATSDGVLVLYDVSRGYVLGLWKAARTSSGSWTAQGSDIYFLNSNGISGIMPQADNTANSGHRGINSAVRQVRLDEIVAGHIDHKLELFVNTTKCAHVFPMTGDECGTTAQFAPPEGALVRIRPDVDLTKLGLSPAALTIARALQTYGAVIGDQTGGPATIGLEGTVAEGRGNLWTGVLAGDSLRSLPFTPSFWQVVKLGYGA